MSLQQIRDVIQEMELTGSTSRLRKRKRQLMAQLDDPFPVHLRPYGTLPPSEKEFRQVMKITKDLLKELEEDAANG